MTREEFTTNYLSSVGAVIMPHNYQTPEVRVIQELIGSIHDPHHQIAELLLSADLAKLNRIENIMVETRVFHYLDVVGMDTK